MIPSQLGKFLIIAGVLLVVVGLLLMAGAKFGHLGRLPGDIVYKGKHVQFYFPIVTCLVLSAVLTLVFWLISYLTKK
jgi:predicted Co/Zn/Cd cation transporter (cation efflux family)